MLRSFAAQRGGMPSSNSSPINLEFRGLSGFIRKTNSIVDYGCCHMNRSRQATPLQYPVRGNLGLAKLAACTWVGRGCLHVGMKARDAGGAAPPLSDPSVPLPNFSTTESLTSSEQKGCGRTSLPLSTFIPTMVEVRSVQIKLQAHVSIS